MMPAVESYHPFVNSHNRVGHPRSYSQYYEGSEGECMYRSLYFTIDLEPWLIESTVLPRRERERECVCTVCVRLRGNGEFETGEKLRNKTIAGSFTLVDHLSNIEIYVNPCQQLQMFGSNCLDVSLMYPRSLVLVIIYSISVLLL